MTPTVMARLSLQKGKAHGVNRPFAGSLFANRFESDVSLSYWSPADGHLQFRNDSFESLAKTTSIMFDGINNVLCFLLANDVFAAECLQDWVSWFE